MQGVGFSLIGAINRLTGSGPFAREVVEVCPVHPDCPFRVSSDLEQLQTIHFDWHIRMAHGVDPQAYYATYIDRPATVTIRKRLYVLMVVLAWGALLVVAALSWVLLMSLPRG